MKRRTNVLRRNSGFIAACVIVAAASFIIVDASMSGILTVELAEDHEDESEEMALTVKKSAPEDTNEVRTYETDVFTVTASGRIKNGVETETESGEERPETETDENGDVIETVVSDERSQDYGENGTDYADEGNSGYEEYAGYGGNDRYADEGNGYSDSYYGSGSYDDGLNSYDSDGNVTIWEYSPYASGGSSTASSGSTGSYGGSESEREEEPDTIIPGISSRYISVSELYPYDKEELRIIRYEIYALHGRIFMSDDLAEYFDGKSWYVPKYMPDYFDDHLSDFLNEYELANLQTIKDYEATFGD